MIDNDTEIDYHSLVFFCFFFFFPSNATFCTCPIGTKSFFQNGVKFFCYCVSTCIRRIVLPQCNTADPGRRWGAVRGADTQKHQLKYTQPQTMFSWITQRDLSIGNIRWMDSTLHIYSNIFNNWSYLHLIGCWIYIERHAQLYINCVCLLLPDRSYLCSFMGSADEPPPPLRTLPVESSNQSGMRCSL